MGAASESVASAPSGAVGGVAAQASAPSVQAEFRGSGLLLVGRVVAIGLNLLVQILTVRYLTREHYGSFSFVLSVVALAANANMIGLARAMSRFAPLYGEREDGQDLLGAIVVSIGSIAVLGVALVSAALAFDGTWQSLFTDSELSAELLILLVAMTPLTAIDAVLEVLAATLAGARAIFVRRHLLTPLLRLSAVVLVMSTGGGPKMLAACYLAAMAFGVLAYVSILVRALRARGLGLRWPRSLPFREVLGYGRSMLLLDVAGVFILHLPAVVLEFVRGASAVAGLRAVVPLATLALAVLQSFKLLYVPLATRSFERGGAVALSEAYWSSARWLALLSFPIFAVCAFLSPQLVVLLFGETYADASVLASIMSVGYYLHAVLGVNTLTLQALGESRRLRATAFAGIFAAIVGNALLVPAFGAVGAAVATTITLLAHDLTNLVLVLRSGRVHRPAPGFGTPYLWVLGATAFLFVAVTLASPPAAVAIPVVALTIAGVWLGTRRSLDLLASFPELGRIPLIRWVVS